jgi:hypothetical protein
MRGDRFGTVVKIGRVVVYVKMDRSGRTIRFTPENLLPIEPTTKAQISAEYAPYDKLPAFESGFNAYGFSVNCPYPPDSVDAQAWDRGLEAAMRWQRGE